VDIVKGNMEETNPIDEAIMSDTVSHIANSDVTGSSSYLGKDSNTTIIDFFNNFLK